MSVKQDRTYARTAQDIERKYRFGKTFSETLGIVSDYRDSVEKVESTLRNEITEQSTILKRDTEQIVATAKEEMTKIINDSVEELSSEVEMKIDADDVSIVVQQHLSGGVDEVVTKTGYRFGADGLNVSKSGSEIENTVDHTGMYVTKSGDEILVANKDGVDAKDLHAKTYLIIGKDEGRSRFEDYGINRTACFWIGG